MIKKGNIINHIFQTICFEFLNNRNLEIFVINSFSKHFLKYNNKYENAKHMQMWLLNRMWFFVLPYFDRLKATV